MMQLLIRNPKPLPKSLEATPFPPVEATPHSHWRDETAIYSLISTISVPELIYLVSKLPDYVEVHIRPESIGISEP